MPMFRRDECLRFVSDGQTVLLAQPGGGAIICTIEKACGHSAFVVNEMKGVRRWCDVEDLFSYEEYRKRSKAAQEREDSEGQGTGVDCDGKSFRYTGRR